MQTKERTQQQARPLYEIAREIYSDWRPMSSYARPYVQAMSQLDNITDAYGLDDARSVILYFLGNAATWRGDTARRIKAELRGMVK